MYRISWQAIVLATIALAIAIVFPWRYAVPFRLDDVILMQWSNAHALLDAFDADKGQIVNSVRPMFAITSWLLTHLTGPEHPLLWHVTLVALLVVALIFLSKLAAYLTRGHSALILTPILYLVGFTSILNVFFWFSDLTYALELAFTTIAWYYGIRGLLDADIGRLTLGLVAGILAVLSKEPAVVMVHVVLIGVLLLERGRIASAWRAMQLRATWLPVLLYVVLLAVTFYIIQVSPTRTNRFFSLSDPQLRWYVGDRISYYSAILCSPIARVLLFSPIVFLGLTQALRSRIGADSVKQLVLLVVAIAFSVLLLKSALSALPLVVLILTSLAVSRSEERSIARPLLPILATVLIAFATLLVTIQLVKTQLTEIAFMMALISSACWVVTGRVVLPILRRYPTASLAALTLGVIVAADGARGKLGTQERVLRDVSAVRWNANDAVVWAAHHLPAHSSLLVTTYMFHGFENPGALTATNDETKLRDQPTFDAGYVYIYLEQLGRSDIDKAYLTDSAEASRVLAAYRAQPNSYLFVQTGLDAEHLHPLLRSSDSLVARFGRAPYPSEIWHVQP